MNDDIRSRLDALSLALEPQPVPKHRYLPIRRDGDVIYLSGKTAMTAGAVAVTGRLETDADVERGRRAARICALNLLATIEQEVGLENVSSVLKLTGFVASGPRFYQQPQVINAASEVLRDVLGEAGDHARSAIGVAALPGDSSVEIELIARVRGGGGDRGPA